VRPPPALAGAQPHAVLDFQEIFMTHSRWQQPPSFPFRLAKRLSVKLASSLAIGLSIPALALAQTPSAALLASDPGTPGSAPPAVLALPAVPTGPTPELPTTIEAARAAWQRANQRVAEFPRGHIDLLRWEAQNPALAPTASASTSASKPDAAATKLPALDLTAALRQSLRHRADLFTDSRMNSLERAGVQRAYAQHVHTLQRAWLEAIAAGQRQRLMAELLEAAASGAELGRRMVQAGNWSQARLLREQLAQAQAQQAWSRAAQAQQAATEQLARLLGVWDAQAVAQLAQRLPTELPGPPAKSLAGSAGTESGDPEAAALRSQPLLAEQRLSAQQALLSVRPDRLAAWSQAVDDALQAPATPPGTTPWLAPQIADQRLLQDHTLQAAVAAESALLFAAAERRAMARAAWGQLQWQLTNALQAQQVVRLQTALEQETVLRYNGMLQSSWELLASASARLNAVDAAQQARRDLWLAQADWDALAAGADVAPTALGAADSNPKTATAGGH